MPENEQDTPETPDLPINEVGEPKTEKSAFVLKDYVTITLSVIAIGTSVLGFYFSNIRVEDNLHAKVIDVSTLRKSKTSKDTMESDTVVLSTIFINSGNRQAVVLEPWFMLSDTSNANGETNGFTFANDNDFPLIIEPKQVKMVKLKATNYSITLNVYQNEKRGAVYQQYMQLQYHAFDSKYHFYNAEGEYEIVIYSSKKYVSSAFFPKSKNDMSLTTPVNLLNPKGLQSLDSLNKGN